MQSLIVKISNPDTVHAIAEMAKRQGTTPEAAALELLETAVLAQKPFEEIVEPIARSFDESGMSAEELDDLITKNPESSPRGETPSDLSRPGVHSRNNSARTSSQGINSTSPASISARRRSISLDQAASISCSEFCSCALPIIYVTQFTVSVASRTR